MSAFSYLASCAPPLVAATSCLACGVSTPMPPKSGMFWALPGGIRIITDGSERENAEARALALDLERLRLGNEAAMAAAQSAQPTPSSIAPQANPEDLLSARIGKFIEHMGGQNRSPKNLRDTEHTLRLFLDLQGGKPLKDYSADDIDAFKGAMRVWPRNASKKPQYRDLTPKEILEKAKRTKSAGLALRPREKHLDRLRLFFGVWVKRRAVPFNPCDGFQVTNKAQDESRTREPFSSADLQTIFSNLPITLALTTAPGEPAEGCIGPAWDNPRGRH